MYHSIFEIKSFAVQPFMFKKPRLLASNKFVTGYTYIWQKRLLKFPYFNKMFLTGQSRIG